MDGEPANTAKTCVNADPVFSAVYILPISSCCSRVAQGTIHIGGSESPCKAVCIQTPYRSARGGGFVLHIRTETLCTDDSRGGTLNIEAHLASSGSIWGKNWNHLGVIGVQLELFGTSFTGQI